MTPGPWHVDDEGESNGASDVWIGTAGGGHSLARLGDDPQLTHEEHVANAHAMAAAPDLLTALKDMLRVCDMLMPGLKYIAIEDYELLNTAQVNARATISALRKVGVE